MLTRLLKAAILVFLVAGVFGQENAMDSRSDLHLDQARTKWIEQVMRSITSVKPGMTRKEVAPLLTEDGGLQFRQQGRYVYARCRYIKVDIDFSAVNDGIEVSPDDRIVKVSRPYLDYPVFD